MYRGRGSTTEIASTARPTRETETLSADHRCLALGFIFRKERRLYHLVICQLQIKQHEFFSKDGIPSTFIFVLETVFYLYMFPFYTDTADIILGTLQFLHQQEGAKEGEERGLQKGGTEMIGLI